MGENDVLGLQSQKDDAGEGLIWNQSRLKLLNSVAGWEMASYLVVYCKAIRRVSGYLGIKVGDKEIIALSMIRACETHLKIHKGVNRVISWSGYTRNWQALMRGAIEKSLANGLLENLPRNGGNRLQLTEMGKRVLDTLDLMAVNVLEEILGLREKPKSRYHENRLRKGEQGRTESHPTN